MEGTKHREINVRLMIGGTLSGIGHVGVTKLLGAMNLPPPIQKQLYSDTQEYIMDYVSKAQQESMNAAVQEAVIQNGYDTNLTVSGDGAWLTRGHTSAHGIAALCSTTQPSKILDTSWLSKCCSKCQGAEYLRHRDPELFEIHKETHSCQLNYKGKFVRIVSSTTYKDIFV
jgi:hypothetical protein